MKRKIITSMIITFVFLLGIGCITHAEVTNYAGKIEPNFKDGAKLEASFNQPYGIALDNEGNLIVVDRYNNRVRKITENNVSTIAGYSNKKDIVGFPLGGLKDGSALESSFNKPRGIAINKKGEIFISDTGNNVIRKISKNIVSTYSGTPKPGLKDGLANVAMFNTPSGITFDSKDNLYVADTLNNKIRVIDTKGTVSTLKFTSSDKKIDLAVLNEPSDVAFDAKGILYIVDSGNQMIKKVVDGKIYKVAGANGVINKQTGYRKSGFANGKASSAKFNFPKSICIAKNGVIFVTDSWNHSIRAIKPDGQVITIAGTGKAGDTSGNVSEAMFNAPIDLAYKDGKLFITDTWNNIIKQIDINFGDAGFDLDEKFITKNIKFEDASEDIKIYLGNEKLKFSKAKPIYYDGKICVPLKDICKKFNAKVMFDKNLKTYTVKIGKMTVKYIIDKDVSLDESGNPIISIRTLAKDLGFLVTWVQKYNSVVITK